MKFVNLKYNSNYVTFVEFIDLNHTKYKFKYF